MMTKFGRRIGAALVLPAVLLASGCAKTDTPVSGSTQAQSSSTSSAASGKVYSDKASFVSALQAGTKDVKTAHTKMEMTGQGQEIKVEGDSRLDPANPASKMTMAMAGMNLELIMVDKKIYVKGIPGQGDANKWAVLDADSAMAKDLSASAGQLDPARLYDEFDKAVTAVKHVGEETVDGEPMNKYELTMDTKAIPDLPTDDAQLPDTLTYTAWLDTKDRLRKVTFELMGLQAVVTMSNYGAPVTITAPPADQTVEATL
jgi:hypothetical protein